MQTGRLSALVIAIVVAFCGCGRGTGETEGRGTTPAPSPGSEDASPPAPIDALPLIDSGPTLSEAAARAVLAEQFRAAGLRIVQDVPLAIEGAELTVDGYDPAAKIGFEYIAESERDTDLVAGERAALAADSGVHVLVLDAADHATVRARAEAFLRAVLAPDAGPG